MDAPMPSPLQTYLTLSENNFEFVNLASLANDKILWEVGARGFGYESGETPL